MGKLVLFTVVMMIYRARIGLSRILLILHYCFVLIPDFIYLCLISPIYMLFLSLCGMLKPVITLSNRYLLPKQPLYSLQ